MKTAVYDGLGRQTQAQVNSFPGSPVYTDTTYDALGRISTVSNPYQSTSDPTYGITTYHYDPLSRVASVTQPDQTVVSNSYYGNCTTVTDEQSKSRTTCSDAAGRLTQVTEAPGVLGYVTTYAYDANNNLLLVNQSGQTRSFTYDGVSRLLSASNPESGTTYYGYDADSNLVTKQDARGIVVCYGTWTGSSCNTSNGYDAMNRLTVKTYSDGTPPASFSYDQGSVTIGNWSSGTLTNPLGRLTEAVTTSGGNVQTAVVYSYDLVGRPQNYWQCTPYNCNNSSLMWPPTVYSYDLAGDIWSWTHPVGFQITNTVNSAQQVTQMQSSRVDSTHPQYPVQNITYTPFGAVSTLTNGCAGSGCTQRQETYSYNNRLQVTQIQLGTSGTPAANFSLGYNYSLPGGDTPPGCLVQAQGSGNNGNVIGYTYMDPVNNNSLSHSALFVYDSLNRLACAQATGNITYNLAFGYNQDGSGHYGNMSCLLSQYTQGLCTPVSFNASTNQISGYSYDAAGNLTANGTCGYAWDAEGRPSSVNTCRTATFISNALGQLVETLDSRYRQEFVYDPSGQYLGSLNGNTGSWQNQNILLGSRQIGNYFSTATRLIHYNNLMSTVAVTDGTGAQLQDQVWYPWGQNWQKVGSTQDLHFATMIPDQELWYTNGRRDSANIGRWLSPDPLYIERGRLADPQQLNLYAYARNNPVSLTDPTGLLVNINCTQVSSDQCNQIVADLNGRKGAAFQVTRNDNGILQVVNQSNVDVSKLSPSEAALFNAIATDTEHTARLDVVPQSDSVQFGKFQGAGLNKLDASDLGLLAGANRQVAGEVVAHEALEAYHSLTGGIEMNFTANHDWANKFFGQVTHPFNADIPATANSPAINFLSWNFGRLNESFMVKTVLTPVPAASIQPPRSGYPPGNIVEVNKER